MKYILAIVVSLLSTCAEKPPQKVKAKQEIPYPVEYMSDYDRKNWEAGCRYDELEWAFHQVLDWNCK